jgi:hypothetical protein
MSLCVAWPCVLGCCARCCPVMAATLCCVWREPAVLMCVCVCAVAHTTAQGCALQVVSGAKFSSRHRTDQRMCTCLRCGTLLMLRFVWTSVCRARVACVCSTPAQQPIIVMSAPPHSPCRGGSSTPPETTLYSLWALLPSACCMCDLLSVLLSVQLIAVRAFAARISACCPPCVDFESVSSGQYESPHTTGEILQGAPSVPPPGLQGPGGCVCGVHACLVCLARTDASRCVPHGVRLPHMMVWSEPSQVWGGQRWRAVGTTKPVSVSVLSMRHARWPRSQHLSASLVGLLVFLSSYTRTTRAFGGSSGRVPQMYVPTTQMHGSLSLFIVIHV